MELRPEEDDPEEQRQNADALCSAVHVLTKTKLRLEWACGQGMDIAWSFLDSNQLSTSSV